MLLRACCRLGLDRVRQRVSSACFKIYEFSTASPPLPRAGAAPLSTASSPMPFAGLQDACENSECGDVSLDMYSCIVVPGRFRHEACYWRPVSARVCTELDNAFARAYFKGHECSTSCADIRGIFTDTLCCPAEARESDQACLTAPASISTAASSCFITLLARELLAAC